MTPLEKFEGAGANVWTYVCGIDVTDYIPMRKLLWRPLRHVGEKASPS